MRFGILVSTLLLSGAAFAQSQNILVNGDFETNAPPCPTPTTAACIGDHYPWPVAPWIVGAGQQPNVITVDGGAHSYGSRGPDVDASAPGVGVPQHYLDVAGGKNDFYQTFTPQCSGTVDFGGWFSTRDDRKGSANVTIRQGTGLSGVVVGVTQPIDLPAGNSNKDPWVQSAFNVPISAGVTYSFIVSMGDDVNFDNGFVRYRLNCDAVPASDPCCPPWTSAKLKDMLAYKSAGGIAAPYTLAFQPTPQFLAQMQAYINYLQSVNPAMSAITIQFRLHDAGNGATPVGGAQIGASHYATWNAGTASGLPTPAPNYFSMPSEAMQVNRWYTIHTGMYLDNNQTWFPDTCANNDVSVRVQVTPAALQFRDSEGTISSQPLSAFRPKL